MWWQTATSNKSSLPEGVPLLTAVLHAGAGAEPGSQASFTYYPRCTALSTQYPDVPDVLAATASLVCYSPRSYSLLQRLGQAVARWVMRGAAPATASPLLPVACMQHE